MKTVRYALAGLAMMAGTAPQALMAAEVQVAAQAPVVSLSVTEEVRSAPDAASFSTGVTTQAPTATEALRQNSAQMSALIERIKKLGVADKDIQTSGINLNAQYDYQQNQPPRFTGYQVSNNVTVTVRDIDRLGELLDQVVQAGSTNLSGPNFFIDDDIAVKAEARKRAVEHAMAQAREYARNFGYSDVRLLTVSESVDGGGNYPQPPRPMAARIVSAEAKAPVQPGEIGTNVTVNFEFAMVQ
ncbi:SIMPL domain-containing protein [Novosphingopyxis iocasae]|uniref:SIMPL domain-containing protein n=1 Tax=Novosphingopyxis iocasae TaxID=2762729 RepID=UPI0016515D5D|nr:SIMPL domain-containing protein [Novosphingopyxis iocasae]|tara:strand:- start:107 stop:835 length:729 start_codon:yes stop_codon:yes gene_type:complete